jgi:hypothetical protein
LGTDIFARGGYFLLETNNVYRDAYIWLIAAVPMFLFSVRKAKDLFMVVVSLGVFFFLFVTGNALYHPWIWMNGFVFLTIYIFAMNVAVLTNE